ncbi:MAG TPA: AMP-binding protein [Pseudomonadales bacterium]|jgi:malonyl-CoA/methylmalonyl-CoA synthetase
MMAATLTQRIVESFERNAERPCLRVPGGRDWSYGELNRLAEKLAGLLAGVPVAGGDRVLVQVEKSPEAVALYLACLRLGAVYVPINTAYTGSEVEYFLRDAEPSLFVCRPSVQPALAEIAGSVPVLTLGADGDGSLLEGALKAEARDEAEPRDPADLAAILYTSGTTGRSKGAMLSQGNLLSNAESLLECWVWRDDDVLLHALPIFHVHGLFIALHCAFLSGTPVTFLAKFDPEAIVECLPESTVLMGVPTFYTRLLDFPGFGADVCRNMRLFISGSAPLTEATFHAWRERTGFEILERYGMSETIIIASNPLNGERLAGTVGFALPGMEVRIADEEGKPLSGDDVGMIEVRGSSVFSGYWRMPEKTAEEIRPDGFFVTGDLGRMDADGRVTIVGRSKDLVISGGYNVYPKEVERLIDELPGVVECAVIGVPHPDFGEAVVAVVVPENEEVSERSVAAGLDGQLARFKQPKRVINIGELPRNAMGKVQKNELRERFADLFAQS